MTVGKSNVIFIVPFLNFLKFLSLKVIKKMKWPRMQQSTQLRSWQPFPECEPSVVKVCKQWMMIKMFLEKIQKYKLKDPVSFLQHCQVQVLSYIVHNMVRWWASLWDIIRAIYSICPQHSTFHSIYMSRSVFNLEAPSSCFPFPKTKFMRSLCFHCYYVHDNLLFSLLPYTLIINKRRQHDTVDWISPVCLCLSLYCKYTLFFL